MDFKSRTTLVMEYLVIGFQGGIVLLLFGLRIEGKTLNDFGDWLSSTRGLSSLSVTALGLAAVYSFGILLDRTWDRLATLLCKPRVRRIWKSIHEPQEEETPSLGRLFYQTETYLLGQEGVREQQLRRRSRLRILRALVFHVPLLTLALLTHHFAWWLVAIGIVLEVMSILAFLQVHKQHIARVAHRHAKQVST